jgi:L-amino acid N-acyltransferase YncA
MTKKDRGRKKDRMKVEEAAIRVAEEGDGPPIAAIYGPYVRDTAISFEIEPPTAQMMADRIARTLETHPWLVAEIGGKVVGYAYAGKHRERPAYRWTVDTTIYLDTSVHRRGIGRALYLILLEILRDQGFCSAFAEIVLPNAGSIRLHESLGFGAIGIHEHIGFKLGCWHDIGYWRMALAQPTLSPCDPVAFADLRVTSGFVKRLQLVGSE